MRIAAPTPSLFGLRPPRRITSRSACFMSPPIVSAEPASRRRTRGAGPVGLAGSMLWASDAGIADCHLIPLTIRRAPRCSYDARWTGSAQSGGVR